MSALITNIEHSLAFAASDTVKVARFVETKVLPVLKQANAEAPTIEAVTSLVTPQPANIERLGFAVLGKDRGPSLTVAAPIGVHRSGLLGKLLPDDFQRELNLP